MAEDQAQVNGTDQTSQIQVPGHQAEVPTYTIIQADGLYPVRLYTGHQD